MKEDIGKNKFSSKDQNITGYCKKNHKGKYIHTLCIHKSFPYSIRTNILLDRNTVKVMQLNTQKLSDNSSP